MIIKVKKWTYKIKIQKKCNYLYKTNKNIQIEKMDIINSHKIKLITNSKEMFQIKTKIFSLIKIQNII